jgi:hypothetical protein
MNISARAVLESAVIAIILSVFVRHELQDESAAVQNGLDIDRIG